MPKSKYHVPGVHLTVHSGKLEGLLSISTSSVGNTFCAMAAKNPDSVCSKCYARRTESYRKGSLTAALLRNNRAFSTDLKEGQYEGGNLPLHVRFNSFGELISTLHVLHIFEICYSYPKTQFSLWTKRPNLIAIVSRIYDIPSNLSIIKSMSKLNLSDKVLSRVQGIYSTLYPFIKAIYAVYDRNQGIPPCGTRCVECARCYPPVKQADGLPSVIKQKLH